MLKEFREFINKGNVLMTAVALVMALYFQTVINGILDGLITPIITALFGQADYKAWTADVGPIEFKPGLVVDALIKFVAVAFVLFLIVRAYNKYAAAHDEDAGPTEIDLLTEIRDSLQKR